MRLSSFVVSVLMLVDIGVSKVKFVANVDESVGGIVGELVVGFSVGFIVVFSAIGPVVVGRCVAG